MTHSIDIIGTARTPFKDKFGIPRQALLIDELTGELHIHAPYHQAEAFRGLNDYSHLWVLWLFHEHLNKEWKPTVRPPRFGGNARKGVFATRSSFRPNAIAQSVVKLTDIRHEKNTTILKIQGPDFLDGTPIIDIKPYIPYADAIHDARSIAAAPEQKLTVIWDIDAQLTADERNVIKQLIALDPRPAYQQDSNREYRMSYKNYCVIWTVINDIARIHALTSL